MAISSGKRAAIGIDLGTTNCCVGVYRDDKIDIIINDHGERTTPSYVAFTETGRLIGSAAKDQEARNLENTVFDVKRMIGRKYIDETVQSDIKQWPFTVIDDNGDPKIQVEFKGEKKTYHPEELSAMLLSKLKEFSEDYLGEGLTDAVITVPAYFNMSQRHATKDAGKLAGLNVLRIINEPTAAAIAYGLDRKRLRKRNVLVFDLGGGTFDVSILTIKDGSFEVKCTTGDTHLGGEDFNSRMVDHFAKEFERKHKKDLTRNKRALRRVRAACEKAKRKLSYTEHANIELDSILNGFDLYSEISRSRFEELNSDLFQKTLKLVEQALRDSQLNKSEINDIVLVGGSTRIPKIRTLLQDFFNGHELSKAVNPDEVVACGAAIEAAVLIGDTSELIKDISLVDVTPLSLGIETDKVKMTTVIKRNTPIPVRKSTDILTLHDNQSSISFPIYEGERELSKENHLLGTFCVSGIPSAPRYKEKCEVTFEISADGILRVTAVHKGTGKANNITVSYDSGRVSANEIKRMIKEAEAYKIVDETERERVKARIDFEVYALRVKRKLQDTTDKQLITENATVLDLVKDALTWHDSNPFATKQEYKRRQQELAKKCQHIAHRQ